jgi:hypothetical protein
VQEVYHNRVAGVTDRCILASARSALTTASA